MEFFPITSFGKPYREFYHLSFSEVYFKLHFNVEIWKSIVFHIKSGTYFAGRQPGSYIPPTEEGGLWGYGGSTNTEVLDNGSVVVSMRRAPALGENNLEEITHSAKTLSLILNMIMSYAYDNEDKLKLEQGQKPQLFHLETIVAKGFHGGSFDLSVSLQARQFLCRFGESRLDETRHLMCEHWKKLFGNDKNKKVNPSWFDVRTKGRGLLHIITLGDCACLGTSPDSFSDDEGCYLVSHNVDTLYQQFNMIVAIAHIWQMVRDGLAKEQPAQVSL